jgi:hypothetical protein
MGADAGSSPSWPQNFSEGHSMPFEKARIAFGPESLSRFTQILEEVTAELVDDGVPVELMRSEAMRARLAQRLLSFAHSWWTDTQIKQLLLRGLRNEISASHMTYQAVSPMTGSDDTVLSNG